MTEQKGMVEYALEYARKGFSIIPVKEKHKILVRWKPFQEKAADEETIKGWWKEWPDANIGIVTGKVSDLMVIDADSEEAYKAFKAELGANIWPAMVSTPSSKYNYHFWFHFIEGIRNGVRSQQVGNCDVRSEGGYILAPPSVGENGKSYQWSKYNLESVGVIHLPTYIMKKLKDNVPIVIRETPTREEETFCEGGNWYYGEIIQHGIRDDALFHIGLLMRKGGAPYQEVESFLKMLVNSGIVDQSSESIDPIEKARAIESYVYNSDSNISKELDQYFEGMAGDETFDLKGVCGWLNIIETKDKAAVRSYVKRKCDNNIFEKVGNRTGVYRKVGTEDEEEIMDLSGPIEKPVDLWMPFDINDYLNFYNGNVIIIAGEGSTGKTAFALNAVMNNMNKFKIEYFTCELGKEELKSRLEPFPIPANEWRFLPVERSGNHKDFLLKGEGNINIIDYLEVPEEAWKIGHDIKSIHDNLEGAIALIFLQKDKGKDLARGGGSSLDKARLYITLESLRDDQGQMHSLCTMLKTKNWKDPHINPTGLQCYYKVVQGGGKFYRSSDWGKTLKDQPHIFDVIK